MEFRKKDAFISLAIAQRATLVNAPPKIKSEQNKLAQAVKNRPVERSSEIRSFLTPQTIQKKQTFTLH